MNRPSALSSYDTADKLVAGSGLLLFIASFLPWFRYSVDGAGIFRDTSSTRNGWGVAFIWGGLPVLLGLALAAAIIATESGFLRRPDLPITWGEVQLGASGVVATLVVLKLLTGERRGVYEVSRSFGLYLAAVAALAMAAGCFVRFQQERVRP